MERLTKIVVVVSMTSAVVFAAVQSGRDIWFLPLVALAAAALAAIAGRLAPERTAGIVLGAGYLVPVLLLSTIWYRYYYLSIWCAAFLGALAPTWRGRWQFPSSVRFPLIAWALAVALTWPIVAWRVLDWHPAILWSQPAARTNTVYAISTAVWISQMALVHLLGLAWIDWLFGRFREGVADAARFSRAIVYPMLACATAGSLIAVYQGLFDLRFLSIGMWPEIGRATGSLVDGNASGALTAIWIAVAVSLVVQAKSGAGAVAMSLATAMLLVATYASGSRTGLLCGVVGLAAGAHMLLSDSRARGRRLAAAIGVALLLLAAVSLMPASVRGPLRRVTEVMPAVSGGNIQSAIRQLWERQGYGTGALAMIADYPLQGVGVGSFHSLVSDYYASTLPAPPALALVSDNAQNWFRHHFAELGLLGSVGWICWCVVLVRTLLRRTVRTERASGLALRYALVGFGLASLLGMPSQNLFVTLTVWTLVFWLFLIVESPQPVPARPSRDRAPIWALALAFVFAGATVYAGLDGLRPTALATRFNYYYQEGVYDVMESASGETQTTGHAVVVMKAPTRTLALTISVAHPDADVKPVDVQVWIDGRLVVRSRFPRGVPLTREFAVPGGNQRFVLETAVDRTYASSESGRPAIGANLSWRFVDDR